MRARRPECPCRNPADGTRLRPNARRGSASPRRPTRRRLRGRARAPCRRRTEPGRRPRRPGPFRRGASAVRPNERRGEPCAPRRSRSRRRRPAHPARGAARRRLRPDPRSGRRREARRCRSSGPRIRMATTPRLFRARRGRDRCHRRRRSEPGCRPESGALCRRCPSRLPEAPSGYHSSARRCSWRRPRRRRG